MSSYRTQDADATRALGRQIGASLKPGDVVGLTGPIGAGKTVIAQGVAEALGIEEAVTSPTFTLISEYQGTLKLYHMDLYRLSSAEEFAWLGVEEMLGGKAVSLIEWSERAWEELPERTIGISITIEKDGERLIVIDDGREVG